MKKKKVMTCPCNEVEFFIQWESEGKYTVEMCPFCGLNLEEEYDFETAKDKNDLDLEDDSDDE